MPMVSRSISIFAICARFRRCRGGELSRAAEAAGLSQPALTQGLGKLERQIGGPLVRPATRWRVADAGANRLGRRCRTGVRLPRRGGVGQGRGEGIDPPRTTDDCPPLEAFRSSRRAKLHRRGAGERPSQPAIHRAVRDLEQICGATLVERRGRGTALAAAGRTMARGARLAAPEIAAGIVKARGDGSDGDRIAIGAMPLSRALLLPHALAAWLRNAPASVIDVVEGSWRELVDPLADGTVDLTIGALREDPPAGVEEVALFTDDSRSSAGRVTRWRRQIGMRAVAAQQWVVGPLARRCARIGRPCSRAALCPTCRSSAGR